MATISGSSAVPVVYTDTGPPETLSWTIVQGSTGLDMTTVTAVNFTVAKPDGTSATWSGSVAAGATTTQLTAIYSFSIGDTSQAGFYTIRPILVVPGGTRKVYPPQQLRSITPQTTQ